ncbi:MAG: hypothetical protein M3291_02220 [Actinomycetota bacterium]|nr:hypothetical protein [Actinomycetota bacterium]
MTDTEQCPGGGHRGTAAGDLGGSSGEHTGLDDPDVLAAAHDAANRLVRVARRLYGDLPAVSSADWPAAPWIVRAAGLVILGEAWLLRTPEEIAADQLKAAAVAISKGHDWAAAAERPSHVQLVARRAEPGPIESFDAAAAARWVATGSSEGATA